MRHVSHFYSAYVARIFACGSIYANSEIFFQKLKLSECTPLFMNAYNMRDAGAVMHSHSQNVVLASMIMGSEFKCSHIEMIKGIKKGNTGVRNQLKIP